MTCRLAKAMWLLPALLAASAAAADDSPLRIVPVDGDARRVEVVFSPPGDGPADVTLRLLDAQGMAGPPLFATVKQRDGDMVLVPRFRLAAGAAYRATAEQQGRRWQRRHETPASDAAVPRVTAIHPGADVLPANCLKFYLHFSTPMREGRAIFDQIRLVEESGAEVPDPWRRVELWADDARRLTLWIHPGRVKQGVNLREEFGPVLEPGRRYRLVVGAEVRSAAGRALGREVVKSFRTAADDHLRPLPSHWKIKPPRAGAREPLEVEFTESLDHAQLRRMLHVETADGEPVPGAGTPVRDDTAWQFLPESPWTESGYRLRVDGQLEDLAGNTPSRVFDRDLSRSGAPPPPRLTRSFTPK